MQVKHFLATVLVGAFALGGMTVSVTGCDKKEEKEEDDGKKKKKKKDDDDGEEAKDEPAADAEPSTDVKDCPGQVKLSGLRKVLKPLSVYTSTDGTGTKLTGLAPGTHIELKAQCGNWVKIHYPSGVGEMSPGWVNVAVNSPDLKPETEEEKKADLEEKKDDEEEKKDDEEEEKPDEEEEKPDEEEEKPDEEEEKPDEEEEKPRRRGG